MKCANLYAVLLGFFASGVSLSLASDLMMVRLGAADCQQGPLYRAEVARAADEWARGLGRRSEPPTQGEAMLFVFDKPGPRSFWMKDVSFPLSIFFFDQGGKLLSAQEMSVEADPSRPKRHYVERGPVAYVLETRAGERALHGDSVRLCFVE